MAFHERPNLKRKMEEARARENALKKNSTRLSDQQRKALQRATSERRAAEVSYYSASGQGHAPWVLQMQRWGLILFVIAMFVLVVSQL